MKSYDLFSQLDRENYTRCLEQTIRSFINAMRRVPGHPEPRSIRVTIRPGESGIELPPPVDVKLMVSFEGDTLGCLSQPPESGVEDSPRQ